MECTQTTPPTISTGVPGHQRNSGSNSTIPAAHLLSRQSSYQKSRHPPPNTIPAKPPTPVTPQQNTNTNSKNCISQHSTVPPPQRTDSLAYNRPERPSGGPVSAHKQLISSHRMQFEFQTRRTLLAFFCGLHCVESTYPKAAPGTTHIYTTHQGHQSGLK